MDEDVKKRIRRMLISCLEVHVNDDLADSFEHLEELGVSVNSIVVLEILINLEQEFNIRLGDISIEQVQHIQSIESLVLQAQLASND